MKIIDTEICPMEWQAMMEVRGRHVDEDIMVEVGADCNHSEQKSKHGTAIRSDGFQVIRCILCAAVGIEILPLNSHRRVPNVDCTKTEEQNGHPEERATLNRAKGFAGGAARPTNPDCCQHGNKCGS